MYIDTVVIAGVLAVVSTAFVVAGVVGFILKAINKPPKPINKNQTL